MLELIVVLAVIALLATLIAPAVLRSREAAQSTVCKSRLKQLGVALQLHHEQHSFFPTRGMHSAQVELLPYLEQKALFDQIKDPPYGLIGRVMKRANVRVLTCPDDPEVDASSQHAISYVMNSGSTGIFGPRRFDGLLGRGRLDEPVRASDVTDGLSNTAAVSESLVSTGAEDELRAVWTIPQSAPSDPDATSLRSFVSACRQLTLDSSLVDGSRARGANWGSLGTHHYDHIMPPNSRSCVYSKPESGGQLLDGGAFSASSTHGGGVNLLFADGGVRFLSDSIALQVWRAFGSRDGGEPETTLGDD